MSTVWPLRFREAGEHFVFSDEAGGWFFGDEQFLKRYARDTLNDNDLDHLASGGQAFERHGDLAHSSFLRRWARRHAGPTGSLGYLILVPTLRCNLACDYCQVSRAAENAKGFDWSEETLSQVLSFIDAIDRDDIKIEFQGGEPLLRLDILTRVRDHCREKFAKPTFVVCSNLQVMDEARWAFFDAPDTFLSTSIDGDQTTQTRQRTHDANQTARFFENAKGFLDRFGADRISALPTIDMHNPVAPEVLLDAYAAFGFQSIYLRPVNQQGFARRRAAPSDEGRIWANYHRAMVEAMIERNYSTGTRYEEFYLTHAIRRVLRSGLDSHVDLRNPALVGDGYLVVDYDGILYPSDEARMMSRVGQIDLSIGTLAEGVDREKASAINAWSFNDLDADCQHCAYQPFCGTDVIDDISRYGRVDVPRPETWFCQRHLSLFDLVFELLGSDDPKVRHSLKQWAGAELLPEHLASVHR